MKVKVILGIVVLFVISIGTYTYQNRYYFYRYLPAKENSNFKVSILNYMMRIIKFLVEE